MPELPEVETVRRTLKPHLVGVVIRGVELRRPDVCRAFSSAGRRVRPSPALLLAGATIRALERRGKHLAVLARDGRALDIHLGMSGSLLLNPATDPPHAHVRWSLSRGSLVFADPRRFGGIWAFPSLDALRTSRWTALGPDALGARANDLAPWLASRRPLKTLLLDQARLAGVGNIYADEALFRCGLNPLRPGASLRPGDLAALTAAIRTTLARAIAARGSSIRSYRDGLGVPGEFQARHMVYGRSGQPCRSCRTTIESRVVTGRTTAWCPTCQPADSG